VVVSIFATGIEYLTENSCNSWALLRWHRPCQQFKTQLRETMAKKLAKSNNETRRTKQGSERVPVTKQTAGGIAGAVLGGIVAGPVGAVVGGVAGAIVGNDTAKAKVTAKKAMAVAAEKVDQASKTSASLMAKRKTAAKRKSAPQKSTVNKKVAKKKSATKSLAASKPSPKKAAKKKPASTKKAAKR
jgi:hypothetical protein